VRVGDDVVLERDRERTHVERDERVLADEHHDVGCEIEET
jgi:hypothetical protein